MSYYEDIELRNIDSLRQKWFNMVIKTWKMPSKQSRAVRKNCSNNPRRRRSLRITDTITSLSGPLHLCCPRWQLGWQRSQNIKFFWTRKVSPWPPLWRGRTCEVRRIPLWLHEFSCERWPRRGARFHCDVDGKNRSLSAAQWETERWRLVCEMRNPPAVEED